jgi:hypothetical protein
LITRQSRSAFRIGHMHRSKPVLYSITLPGKSARDGGISRPEIDASKNYSVSMTTCRTPVRKEAPNIATRASMATSNTVSLVPTIQSIISRIGAPVISMIKLDRFVEEAGVF